MVVYEKIEGLRDEMESARETYPDKLEKIEGIRNSLNKAVEQVTLDKVYVWDDILDYLHERLEVEVYGVARKIEPKSI